MKAAWEADYHCRQFCDMAHACPSGLSCTTFLEWKFMACMPPAPDAGTDAATDASLD